jgi:hypothetical protein
MSMEYFKNSGADLLKISFCETEVTLIDVDYPSHWASSHRRCDSSVSLHHKAKQATLLHTKTQMNGTDLMMSSVIEKILQVTIDTAKFPASTLPPKKRQSHYFGAKSLHSFFTSQESQLSNDY